MPTVAIVGRPNVGKSTLFNALLGQRKAIVSDISGTTRDNVIARIEPADQFGDSEGLLPYYLVDTAGLTNAKGETLEKAVVDQALGAIDQADVILFVLDSKKEVTLDDQEIIDRLRKHGEKVLLIANKSDDGETPKVLEWTSFGLGMPHCISAKNFFGVWELQDALQEKFKELGFESPKKEEDSQGEDKPIHLAIVGRPNVGKSSLFNTLLGDKRAVVSDVSGTTRDTLDAEYTGEDGQKYILVDSAGVRRPGKIGFQNIEYWAKVRTTQAIERADVCLLLIDALEGVTHQDLAIVNTILEAGKGLILGVNKFDLVRDKSKGEETDEREFDEVEMWNEDLDKVRHRYLAYLKRKIEFLPWAPALFFSASTARGVKDIWDNVKEIFQERHKRIDTSELNRLVPELYHGHIIPSKGKRTGKLKYASQVDTAPPKFLFFVNNADLFHFSYKRYLENKLRDKYGFFGTPITVEFRDAKRD